MAPMANLSRPELVRNKAIDSMGMLLLRPNSSTQEHSCGQTDEMLPLELQCDNKPKGFSHVQTTYNLVRSPQTGGFCGIYPKVSHTNKKKSTLVLGHLSPFWDAGKTGEMSFFCLFF